MKATPIYNEQELIGLLKQRDQAAFSYLYDNYSSVLYGAVLDIVPDHAIATDVLQEVFIKIWRQLDNYDPQRGRLFSWMFRIARTVSLDVVRSKDWRNSRRNNELSESHLLLADKPHRMDDTGLRKAVQQLKEEHRTLIELSYFQGYTQEEMAKLLDIPLGTVKTRLRAALIQLRQMITK